MQSSITNLPSVDSVKGQYPLKDIVASMKSKFDNDIISAINNKDKFVVVVGPCSADNYDSMVQYLTNLQELSKYVEDKILIVARVYTAKARTDGSGYLGKVFNESANMPIDIVNGIVKCRQLMLKCIEIGLPIADELLYPFVLPYLDDLVSYYFLGARSSMDMLHRDIASGLGTAVGVKNGIDGALLAVAKSVNHIQTSRTYGHQGVVWHTSGNVNSHVVLRGGHNGVDFVPNCREEDTLTVKNLCSQLELANDFVMVDCSHANSAKVAINQLTNAMSVLKDANVNGIMLESYLVSGSGDLYGQSQTDSCLSWEDTDELIRDIYKSL